MPGEAVGARAGGGGRRGGLRRLIGLGMAGGLCGAALLILSDVLKAVPLEIQLVLFHPLTLLLALAASVVFGPTRPIREWLGRQGARWRSIAARHLPRRVASLADKTRRLVTSPHRI